ncbi:hypothetical protein BBJ28_00007190 [Nothophytophthora sp. Chile5]|nr:hypothetical protein BBJ28_00007190 [Nothophytophthora sp. Chile5]
MSSNDSSSLPPIASPVVIPLLAAAKPHCPPRKQLPQGTGGAGASTMSSADQLPESDGASTETTAVEPSTSSSDALSTGQKGKAQLIAMSPDLEVLCQENGLSASQFARHSGSVTTLDMFLGFWTSMQSVMHFPALRELSIVNQPTICALEGLTSCVNLERLCVTECSLTRIANLHCCTKLRQLNLSANRIQRLENLDRLANLEKLWVNQNLLANLDGLWKLTKLTQLWACRNKIDQLNTALNCCVNLTELNLADNRLSCFKGLLSLTNLDQLDVLMLSDPHYGDNPVCRLCNYQTYLMCQLPQLRYLDTVELSARNKQIAEATMIKKKMYYNMRIKAIKREIHARIKHAETIRNQAEHHIEVSVAALVRQKKEMESFVSDSSGLAAKGAAAQDMLVKLEKKLECVNSCLRDRYTSVYRMNQAYERLSTGLRCTSEMNIARLMLELETGGNIRLEDGKPSDAWFVSCVELVRSRLLPTELQKFGINDIRINRVTRINNRFLRNRFQARMEEVLVAPERKVKDNVSKKGVTVPNDVDGEREAENMGVVPPSESEQLGNQSLCPGSALETSLEYLFYVHSPYLEDQQLRGTADAEQLYVAEHGFRGSSEYTAMGLDGGVKLSNSIALLDAPRIAATLASKGQQVQEETRSPQTNTAVLNTGNDVKRALELAVAGDWELPSCVLLVAKVFPGYTKCISNADIALAKAAVTSRSNPAATQNVAGLQSLQVMHGSAAATTTGGEPTVNKQKLYYVLDKALVLPEYFVEYQYTLAGGALGSSRGNDTPLRECRLEKSPRDVHPTNDDVMNFGMATKQVDEFERKYRIRRSQSPLMDQSDVYSNADEDVVRLLQMEPLLPMVAPIENAAASMSMAQTRLQAVTSCRLKHLNLLGCELEAIPDLSALKDHLEVLVLSYNKIQTTCSNLEVLTKLHTLDLSYNHIARMGNLDQLSRLRTLEVTHNLLRLFEDVAYIGKTLGNRALKQLDLRKNSICESKRYRIHVLQHLPRLEQLDQQLVSREEVTMAQRLVTQLSLPKVWDLHCRKTQATLSSTADTTTIPPSNHHPESDDEAAEVCTSSVYKSGWSSLEELNLGHELVGAIEGLNNAVNLRVASFADNAIKRIEGLEACTRLEELCLDDNEITQIENLESLTSLKKLHLGRNRLTVIQRLNTLENLIQLSLEENQISSLRGLGSAMKLMELYLGNNQIENLKEIQHLKALPKLTILDLSGNGITRLADYRLYVVYYLRRVKVLDCVSVSAQDQSNAKQKYSGKLTLEFILDKCGGVGSAMPSGCAGGNPFDRIFEMDLSSCRIREMGGIPGAMFVTIQEINLENNQISDISGLEALPKLRILNLNRNRIETLMPSSSQSVGYTLPDGYESNERGILACLNLEQLHLAYNQITDMTMLGLQFLDALKILHLQGNAIVCFAGLECNTELVELRLDKNRIRQLDSQSTLALRQLKYLGLEDNGLKSLSNFNNMLNLEVSDVVLLGFTLELSNNRVTDLEEADKLAALPSLVDLRLVNNPLTKKHLYRQHVLYKLNSLKAFDGKDVFSDEKERIDILFIHERAAATVSGGASTVSEKPADTRSTVFQPHLILTPSSIPSKSASSSAVSQVAGIPYNAVLTGSLLRKTPSTPLAYGSAQTPAPVQLTAAYMPPEHHGDPTIEIAPSSATTRSMLVPAHSSLRNLVSNGSQNAGSSSLLGSSTVTVASALSGSLVKMNSATGVEQIYIGSSLRSDRRRLSSVHYDQSISGLWTV